jgi:hypothetical protein
MKDLDSGFGNGHKGLVGQERLKKFWLVKLNKICLINLSQAMAEFWPVLLLGAEAVSYLRWNC